MLETPSPPGRGPSLILKFPAGLDNRAREYALPEGAARVVDNLDVTRDGGLLCRKGTRLVASGDCTALYTHPRQRYTLLVRNGQLCAMGADETLTVLTTVAGPVVYATLDDEIYWSDGATVGRVTAAGALALWGLTTPPPPVCTVATSGGLPAGDYQVTMTAIHSSGLESGAGEPVSITLPEGGGIGVTVPAATASYTFGLYATPVYGSRDELRHVATLAPGSSAILGPLSFGKKLDGLFAIKPPAAQCLASHKGRLWMGSGSAVWFTSTLSPHRVVPDVGYYPFESTVTMVGAAEDGVYVGLVDRVYFLQGNDPAQMTRRPVSSIGALPGGGQELPVDVFLGQNSFPSRQCYWWDVEGVFCVGKPGGIIVRPHQDRYAAGAASAGVGCSRVYQGLRQVVSVLSHSDPLVTGWTAVDVA